MKKSSYGFLWKIKNFHVTMNCRYNFVLRKDKENNDMNIIGHVYTDFQEKFGIPRQSGLVDELTGLLNKEGFYRRSREFLEKHSEADARIVYINIENFKLVNDLFGEDAGDGFLKSEAKRS